MIVQIITPQNSKTYVDVAWLEVTSVTGNFIILPGHAPIIATLIPDKPLILMLENEKTELIHLQQPAILELTHDAVTVII